MPIMVDRDEIIPVAGDAEVARVYLNRQLVWQKTDQLDTGSIFDYARTQEDGIFTETVNGEDYEFEIINFNGDIIIAEDTALGDVSSVNARMVIAHYHGNLTVNADVTLTAVDNGEGYNGPKGLFIFVDGALTNNGTISMTARGATAPGQNVYLYKNADQTWEYIPADGADGGVTSAVKTTEAGTGTCTSVSVKGADAPAGSRRTGGGSSGRGYGSDSSTSYYTQVTGGAGGKGTSYSGGTGGGSSAGANLGGLTGGAGNGNGGSGGNAHARRSGGSTMSAYGGVGNPGGLQAIATGSTNSPTLPANNCGTGGLLIMYARNIVNNGRILSEGTPTKTTTLTGTTQAGGQSGGGSINIFHKNGYTGTAPSAAGPPALSNIAKGGDGCVTIMQI